MMVNKIASDINAGNTNMSEEDLDNIINNINNITNINKLYNKKYICDKILHCSSSSFDNYVKLGIIPKGIKEYGSKELKWEAKLFTKEFITKVNKYRNKQGII